MKLNRLELTLITLSVIIFVPIQIIISLKLIGNNRIKDSDKSKQGLVVLSIFSVISQSVVLLIQTIVPYYTYKRNKKSFNDPTHSSLQTITTNNKQEKTHVISLLHILRHKYGFFLFLDQLVQELSFENLSVLIEIYQFKYVTRNILNEYQEKRKWRTSSLIRSKKKYSKSRPKQLNLASTTKLSNIESGKPAQLSKQNSLKDTSKNNKKWPKTIDELKVQCSQSEDLEHTKTPSPSTPDPTTPTSAQDITPESTPAAPDLSRAMSTDSEDSQFSVYTKNKSNADSDYFSQMLSKLPWHGIPLTISISNAPGFDKFIQAQNIFNKYIDKQSYYTINISSSARYLIEAKMEQLLLWKEKQKQQEIIKLDMPKGKARALKIPQNTSTELVRANDLSPDEDIDDDTINMDDIKEEEEVKLNMDGMDEDDGSESITQQQPTPDPIIDIDIHSTIITQNVSSQSNHNINNNHILQHSMNNISLHLQLSHEIETITSEQQFEEELMTLFDPVLPDIFHNLEDSMMRFRKTKQFRALTESDNNC